MDRDRGLADLGGRTDLAGLAGLMADHVVRLDGGLSTALEEHGHLLTDSLWTARLLLEAPAEVTAAHAAFVAAGAEVLITASYQVSEQGFMAAGLSAADASNALRASVGAARAAGGALRRSSFHLRGDFGGFLRADAAHFAAIRIAPSRRMTSPLSMTFSTMERTSASGPTDAK